MQNWEVRTLSFHAAANALVCYDTHTHTHTHTSRQMREAKRVLARKRASEAV